MEHNKDTIHYFSTLLLRCYNFKKYIELIFNISNQMEHLATFPLRFSRKEHIRFI